MNLIELQRSLRQLRLGGMAAVLETRLRHAQAEPMAPIDLISCLVGDELQRRSDRLLERRRKLAGFRDPQAALANFDFTFNPKMNRSLIFDLAACGFIGKREDAIWPKRSVERRFSKAIACCIARHIAYSRNWPKPSWTAPASSTWNRWRPCRC